MSHQLSTRVSDRINELVHLIKQLEQSDPAYAGVPCESVQQLLQAAIRLYARKVDSREDDSPVPSPLPPETEVTATEAVIVVSQLLKSMDIAPFELEMWRQLGVY